MNTRNRIAEIDRRLGTQRLVFFGTRGSDAETLVQIPQFAEIFSQVAPLRAVSVPETCLERLTNERVDLDSYDIDRDRGPEVKEIRRALLNAFEQPAAVLAYRPCAVLASAWFPRSDRVRHMGIFHQKQASFEHKSWVESQLATCGVKVLPWSYYADDELNLILEAVRAGPMVLRANKTDGGAGVRFVERSHELQSSWPIHFDGFLAAAPFLSPSIPLNINACVFPTGEVTLHGPSLQLIGVDVATTRRFGYCGNDFARIADMDTRLIKDFEKIVIRTGKWLHSNGYLGVFGVDALIYGDEVYLTEVNPRFQGSSLMSAYIDKELDRPDLYLDHIAAFLGLGPPRCIPLCELVKKQPPYAHVVCHNGKPGPVRSTVSSSDPMPVRCRLIPEKVVYVKPNAITFQAVFPRSVTTDGVSLLPEAEANIRSLIDQLYAGDDAAPSRPRDIPSNPGSPPAQPQSPG